MHGIFMRKIPHNHGILSIMKAGEKKPREGQNGNYEITRNNVKFYLLCLAIVICWGWCCLYIFCVFYHRELFPRGLIKYFSFLWRDWSRCWKWFCFIAIDRKFALPTNYRNAEEVYEYLKAPQITSNFLLSGKLSLLHRTKISEVNPFINFEYFNNKLNSVQNHPQRNLNLEYIFGVMLDICVNFKSYK